MNRLQNILKKIFEWSDKTFGVGCKKELLTVPKLYHLKKEIDELIEITERYYIAKNAKGITTADKGLMYMGKVSEEFADCFFLLFDSARCYGMDLEMIISAMEYKLEINKKRQWGISDRDGVIEHIN